MDSDDIAMLPKSGLPGAMNETSSQFNHDAKSVSTPDTCRICRGEGSETEHLFHPCKCSGSIKFVHQDCLMAWLSHSNKQHCELCKASFRFTRLYRDDMPASLPWRIFIPRVLLHVAKSILFMLRSCLALSVWLLILPYSIRYSWRSLFYMVDVEWARPTTTNSHSETNASNDFPGTLLSDDYSLGPLAFRATRLAIHSIASFALTLVGEDEAISALGPMPTNHSNDVKRSSLLSGLAKSPMLSANVPLNNRIIDILEGQLIVVIVIVSWLVITLIRESILQQQGAIAAAADLAEARIERENAQARVVEAVAGRPELLEHPVHESGFDTTSVPDTASMPSSTAGVVWSGSSSLTDESSISGQNGNRDDVAVSTETHLSSPSPAVARPPLPSRQTSISAHEVHRTLEESTIQAFNLTNEFGSPSNGFDDQSTFSPELRETLPSSEEVPSYTDGHVAEQETGTANYRQDNHSEHRTSVDPDSGASSSDHVADPDASGETSYDTQVYGEYSEGLRSSATIADDTSRSRTEVDDVQAHHDAEDHDDAEQAIEPPEAVRDGPGRLRWLYDLFWHDIELPDGAWPAPLPLANDMLADNGDLIDIHEPLAAPNIVFEEVDPVDDDGELNVQDIEEAEDAEDLQGAIQGILELLGINGPLVLLAQATAFSGAFVTVNLWGIIGVPYMAGKLALLYLAHPFFFGVLVPLQMAKTIVNVVSDAIACMLDVVMIMISSVASYAPDSAFLVSLITLRDQCSSLLQWAVHDLKIVAPRLYSNLAMHLSSDRISDSSFLLLTMTSRQSLQELKDESATVSAFALKAIFGLLSPTTYQGWRIKHVGQTVSATLDFIRAFWPLTSKQAKTRAGEIYQTLLLAGNHTLSLGPVPDRSMTHWSATDRIVTTFLGYAFIGMLTAIYLSSKPPVFSSGLLRAIESTLISVMVSTGLILKVVLIIGTELITFPVFRGLLLDIATIPIFDGATFASRLTYAQESPYLAILLHWFLGMACTLSFGSFISMLRKKLRSGVLDFVKGPDDPDFHPVRVVLELSVPAQIKSLISAALFYMVLILCGLGVPTWLIYWVGHGTLPIEWTSPEPSLEFPIGFILYSIAVPWMLKYLGPMTHAPRVFDWWLRRAAHGLRLSHFLFGTRLKDEESARQSRLWRKVRPGHDEHQAQSSGRYVQVPASDRARAPGEKRVFKQTTEAEVEASEAIFASKATSSSKRPMWRAVYVPPAFRGRLILFVLALWSLCFLIGFNITVTPLWTGRLLCRFVLASRGYRFGDTWAYSLGVNLMLTSACLVKFALKMSDNLERRGNDRMTIREVWDVVCDFARCTFDVVWVYGGVAVLVPLLCAAVLQLYLLVPWQTYLNRGTASGIATCLDPTQPSAIFAGLCPAPHPTVSTVRLVIWPEWAVGHIIGSTLAKMLWRHNHRFFHAIADRVVRHGYLRPDRRLANRAVFTPLLLLMTVILGGPLLVAWTVNGMSSTQFDLLGLARPQSVLVYRFTYPACALICLTGYLTTRAVRGTLRWRNEIRDEVYLLGSKLHNFGDVRPAEGSKALLMPDAETTLAM